MEFSLEAALSPSATMGHLGYVLLVASMLMRRMVLLRLLVIASALVGIAYSYLILSDPVGTFWEALLVTINVVQLFLTWWLDRVSQFDAREAALREAHLPGLSPGRCRMLLSSGRWRTLEAGSVLTRQGEPVPALYYLSEGTATVQVGGRQVATTGPACFIGEMTIATREPAFATVVVDAKTEVWSIEADEFHRLAQRRPEIAHALESAFFRTVRGRLVERNRRDAIADLA